jgi:UrcA family protein
MNTVKPDRHSSSRWPVAIASLACLLGATQALATAPAETRSVSVRYADLDLTSAVGAAALYHRIEEAAQVVCGDEKHRLAALSYVNRCESIAIYDAVAAVNAPLLSATHNTYRVANLTAMLKE